MLRPLGLASFVGMWRVIRRLSAIGLEVGILVAVRRPYPREMGRRAELKMECSVGAQFGCVCARSRDTRGRHFLGVSSVS